MVVGDWQVELQKGSDSTREIIEGDTLQPQFPLQLDEVLVKTVATITDIQKIVEGVSQGKGTVGRLFAEDSVITLANRIGNDVHRLVGKMEGTVSGLDTVLNTYNRLGANGGGLVDSLVSAANRLNTILGSFAPLAEQMQPLPAEIDKVLKGVQKDLAEAEKLLRAVQKHGLIRKQVREVEKEDSLGKEKE
jgi:ABC-type transporter Mla subunit MlaD